MDMQIAISNRFQVNMSIRVEPWSEEFQLEPGQKFEIVFSGPERGLVECEIGPNSVTMYGWEGSIFSIPAQASGV